MYSIIDTTYKYQPPSRLGCSSFKSRVFTLTASHVSSAASGKHKHEAPVRKRRREMWVRSVILCVCVWLRGDDDAEVRVARSVLVASYPRMLERQALARLEGYFWNFFLQPPEFCEVMHGTRRVEANGQQCNNLRRHRSPTEVSPTGACIGFRGGEDMYLSSNLGMVVPWVRRDAGTTFNVGNKLVYLNGRQTLTAETLMLSWWMLATIVDICPRRVFSQAVSNSHCNYATSSMTGRSGVWSSTTSFRAEAVREARVE
ncbi:uncharacterized protein LY89DRAFT_674328 [Mollisia scopiformis]|uniref:Uncharacterized protein n=1 Tax=Mollisia scopiformis TaxID=149040 RepID=A0A194WUX1_MOLSC|nr:uncharacterized protein LY89DRAFT_674328 [Mollisia scopiformis]KUJ11766.1 hypothetical protein LY89DRAFT_674328 [Mollisia scopiformis]